MLVGAMSDSIHEVLYLDFAADGFPKHCHFFID